MKIKGEKTIDGTKLNCITDVIRIVGMSRHKDEIALAVDVFNVASMLNINVMHFDTPNHPKQTPVTLNGILSHIKHCFYHIEKGDEPRWRGFTLERGKDYITLNFTK